MRREKWDRGDWAGTLAGVREALGLAARAGGVRRPRPA